MKKQIVVYVFSILFLLVLTSVSFAGPAKCYGLESDLIEIPVGGYIEIGVSLYTYGGYDSTNKQFLLSMTDCKNIEGKYSAGMIHFPDSTERVYSLGLSPNNLSFKLIKATDLSLKIQILCPN